MTEPHAQRSAARRVLLLAALAGLALATGCSYPKAVHTYEYLISYDRMARDYDPMLSLVYVPEAVDLSRYRGVIIGDVGVGDLWVEQAPEALGFATLFRVDLRGELAKLGIFEFVSLDKALLEGQESLQDVLLVEGKITKFDMGSGFWRYVSWFSSLLQEGATDLQIEGRITEAASGRLVAEFVDRRRHFANTPFGPNPSNFRRGFAMGVTCDDTAECLARFMQMACEEGLPEIAVVAEEAD